MDILGSIMKKMEKPPTLLDEKERQMRKLQQERLKKEQEEKEKRFKEFQQKMTEEVKKFVEDESRTRHSFEPMDKAFRSILYSIIEDAEAGLVAHSFGREEAERHVMVFKEGDVPCDSEMFALKRGEPYVPASTSEGPEDDSSVKEEEDTPKKLRRNKNAPPPDYLQKYQKHLGQLKFDKEAAVKAQADSNRSYGCVSSEQKRDKRTIEETLADIRARKKQKSDEPQPSSS